MFDLIQIYKADLSSSLVINELTGTLKYPVRRFIWGQPTRGDDLPKLQQAGQHDRYKNVDAMPVMMEGDLLGADTDAYWVNRKALLEIVVPDETQTLRYHSQIRIKLNGDSETYWCNVTLEDYDAPLEAFFPTRTPFIFQWKNPYGYWRKLSNNAAVKI